MATDGAPVTAEQVLHGVESLHAGVEAPKRFAET
jgi:hypothetical protein